jgi:hypothetical protein
MCNIVYMHMPTTAGDYMKFTLPMAFTVTTLSWGLLEYWDAWDNSGELQNALNAIRWPLDYFIKCVLYSYMNLRRSLYGHKLSTLFVWGSVGMSIPWFLT